MNARLTQKIEQVEKYIEELTIIRPSSIEEYLGDIKTKAACERYLERIIEGLVDIAHLKIKKMPENWLPNGGRAPGYSPVFSLW